MGGPFKKKQRHWLCVACIYSSIYSPWIAKYQLTRCLALIFSVCKPPAHKLFGCWYVKELQLGPRYLHDKSEVRLTIMIWCPIFGACLGGGNSNIFYFHPYLGKWSNLTNIFQMGWNHQLDVFLNPSVVNCSHTVASDRADRDYEWAVWLGVCSAPGRWLLHITPTKNLHVHGTT